MPPIPVYLATLSPKSLEFTGEVADGWLGTSFMPEHAGVFLDPLSRGAARAGRTLADLDLQAGGTVAFGDHVEELIAERRPGLAFTLGAMGSARHNFYNDAFRRAGYVDTAEEVQRLWLAGRRDEATARVPDELVLKTNLIGTEAMVRARLAAYRAARHHDLARRARGADARRAPRHPRPPHQARARGGHEPAMNARGRSPSPRMMTLLVMLVTVSMADSATARTGEAGVATSTATSSKERGRPAGTSTARTGSRRPTRSSPLGPR